MRARPGSPSCMTAALLATSLAVVLVLICHLESSTCLVEARYLPTRSDKSEIGTLKEIIRGLLIESATPDRQQRQSPFYQRQAGMRAYLERRAAEQSMGSANGEDSYGGFMASPLETGGQLYKPLNQRPDR